MSIALSSRQTRWYFDLSNRPLQIFLFLLPFVVFYEFGMWRLTRTHGHEGVLSITAYEMIKDAMSLFGATGLYLPGVLLLSVLVIWHVLTRQKWEMHLGVPAVLLLESIILALPLVVLNQVLQRLVAPIGPAAGDLMQLAEGTWESMNLVERLTLSVGAGLYEELLFRMVAIAVVHMVIVDLMRQKETIGRAGAVIASALLFAYYHELSPGGSFEWHLAAFYFLAGVYFGLLYIIRGFGIVVGAHAVYDVLVIIALPWLMGK